MKSFNFHLTQGICFANIRHQTSDIRHQTSDIRHQTSAGASRRREALLTAIVLCLAFGLFASCSLFTSSSTGSLSFSLDKATVQKISKMAEEKETSSVRSYEGEADKVLLDGIYLDLEILGDYSAKKSLSLQNDSDIILFFEEIPLGIRVYAKANVYKIENQLTYTVLEGSSEKIVVKGGENKISISLKKTNYITGTLPNTQMVLYNYYSQMAEGSSTSYGYKYYLTDNASQAISNSSLVTTSISSSYVNSFCFDLEGNAYFLFCANDNGSKVSSSKSDFQEITLSNSLYTGSGSSGIMVDRATNIFYGYTTNETQFSVYKYPTLISEGSESGSSSSEGSGTNESETICYKGDSFYSSDNTSSALKPILFSIHNEIVYVLCYRENISGTVSTREYFLATFNLTSGNFVEAQGQQQPNDYYSVTPLKIISLSLPSASSSTSLTFTDMLYQNGAVYILVKEEVLTSTTKSINFYARGAVIKYDTIFETTKIIGWTDSAISNKNKYLYCYKDSDGSRFKTSGGENYESADFVLIKASDVKNTSGESLLNLYSPASESEQKFFAPKKFVAVKPKKLVISEDGVAFYTDENGAYNLKNMNCIVTVDLETFALTRQIVDSSVKFDSEYENGSGYITCNGSIFQEMDDSTSLYSASSKNNSLQNCIYSSSSDNNGMGSNDWFGNAGCVKPGIVVSN